MTDESQPGVLAAIWEYRWMSAAIVALVVAVSVSVGVLVQPRVQVKATILLSPPPQNSVLAPNIQGDASLARYTSQRAAFVRGDAMLKSISKRLAGKSGIRRSITSLRHDLAASPSSTSNAIVIVAKGDSATKAVRLAAAAVSAYQAETKKQVQSLTAAAVASIKLSADRVQFDAAVGSSSQSSIANTLSQLAIQASSIRTGSALFGDGVESVIAPRTDAVTRPSLPIREAALGIVLGLAIAGTVAWIRADDEDDPDAVETVR